MRLSLCAYCLGIATATYMLDPASTWRLAVSLAVAAGILLRVLSAPGGRVALILSSFYLGIAWHGLWAEQQIGQRLPAKLAGVDMEVSGYISELPQWRDGRWRFAFDIEHSTLGFAPRRVLLSYYGPESLRAGQRWRWRLRLQAPHGFANPGGFDYEAYLTQRGISARGYVRDSVAPVLLAEAGPAVLALRGQIRERIRALPLRTDLGGMVSALVIGDRSGLSQSQWKLFAATGTNHLFVISGLHIGLIALCAYVTLRQAGRLLPGLGLRLPVQKLAMLGALLAALFYALLAGFSLSTQRAIVMCAVLICTGLLDHRMQVSLRLLIALAAVLSINPLAVTNMGLWFSFIAVAALLINAGQGERGAAAWRWLRPQLAVFLLLSPALLFFTGQFSLLAPLVNLLLIPLVGMIVVPLALAGTGLLFLLPDLGAALVGLAARVLDWVLLALPWLTHSPAGAPVSGLSAAPVASLALGLAAILLLLPLSGDMRRLALLLCLPLVLGQWFSRERPAYGELHAHILDVGQGLGVFLQTRNHALLYDTGARFHEEFDLGEAVVVPVLRHLNVRRLDRVVISHWDNDHSGGLDSVLARHPAAALYSSPPHIGLACEGSESWRWDGVVFRFLQVPGAIAGSTNDSSCVLQVAGGNFSLLLPGDIERGSERQLAGYYQQALASDVLLAPHHGSNSSSSWPFIKLVDPALVVYSAGLNNSFGHPAAAVQARYQQLGAAALNTALTGHIRIEAAPGHGLKFRLYRDEHPRYWH